MLQESADVIPVPFKFDHQVKSSPGLYLKSPIGSEDNIDNNDVAQSSPYKETKLLIDYATPLKNDVVLNEKASSSRNVLEKVYQLKVMIVTSRTYLPSNESSETKLKDIKLNLTKF